MPIPGTHHFVVDRDSADLALDDEIAGMDNDGNEPESITRFLTLPTVTQWCNPRMKDPVVDFLKSVNLTSNQYIAVATQMQQEREEALREKERNKLEREETRKRKASEKEEAATARALAREEAQRLKGIRIAEVPAAKSRRAVEKEANARMKAERAVAVAAAKA
jgi:hypothetical protein